MPEDDEEPDVDFEGRPARRDREGRGQRQRRQEQQAADAPRAAHQLPARSRSSRCASSRRCSARISAARSSARTASSAAIASSFISGATSCPENFAHEKRAVKRDVERRLTSRSARIRCQVLVGRLRRVTRKAERAERPLHSCVRGDDGLARIGLGAQVVERVVEDVGEGRAERLGEGRQAPPAGAVGQVPRHHGRSRRARGRRARSRCRTAARSELESPASGSRAPGSGRSAPRAGGAGPR